MRTNKKKTMVSSKIKIVTFQPPPREKEPSPRRPACITRTQRHLEALWSDLRPMSIYIVNVRAGCQQIEYTLF